MTSKNRIVEEVKRRNCGQRSGVRLFRILPLHQDVDVMSKMLIELSERLGRATSDMGLTLEAQAFSKQCVEDPAVCFTIPAAVLTGRGP